MQATGSSRRAISVTKSRAPERTVYWARNSSVSSAGSSSKPIPDHSSAGVIRPRTAWWWSCSTISSSTSRSRPRAKETRTWAGSSAGSYSTPSGLITTCRSLRCGGSAAGSAGRTSDSCVTVGSMLRSRALRSSRKPATAISTESPTSTNAAHATHRRVTAAPLSSWAVMSMLTAPCPISMTSCCSAPTGRSSTNSMVTPPRAALTSGIGSPNGSPPRRSVSSESVNRSSPSDKSTTPVTW